MTTPRTPYDEAIALKQRTLAAAVTFTIDERVELDILLAQQLGYLRAKAESALLLEAARLAWGVLSGQLGDPDGTILKQLGEAAWPTHAERGAL
ncbi:MAG: hypothetical protein HY459_02055 [Parcubacteria group bacterium]|nr:hypothetical protein [Parcubacteria group bacterium]